MHSGDFSDKLSGMSPRSEHFFYSGGAFCTNNSVLRDPRSFSRQPLFVSIFILQTVFKRTLMDSLLAFFFRSLSSEGFSFLLIFFSFFSSLCGFLRNFSINLLRGSITAAGNSASSRMIGSRVGRRAASNRWSIGSIEILTISVDIEFRIDFIYLLIKD